jgi:argininosuccinate lyase
VSGEPRHERRLKQPPSPLMQEIYGAPHLAADTARFPYHIAAHRAHAVMLVECHIVAREDGAAILGALDTLETTGVRALSLRPELNDLFTCTEAHLVEALGEAVGGRLHTGRSRNDLFMAIERMVARDVINGVVEQIVALQATLLARAREHAATVFPGYTHHSQQAQPITFGHFLLGHHDALHRDVERLESAYARANRSPLGGAALAGTGFPIDRERLAALLGFDGLVEHTGDACGSRDFQLEIAAALTILGSNLGRLAESLILYTASELGHVELADELASVSSIMPQKKNPVSLELVEAFGARSTGHLAAMLAILKSATLGASRETGYCDGELAAIAQDTSAALRIAAGVVASLRVIPGRALAAIDRSLATATELADSLVRTRGLSFRQAHDVVGRVVARVLDEGADGRITAALVNETARELSGLELTLTESEVREALDPRAGVEIRATRGGPAPREVLRMGEARRRSLEDTERRLDGRRLALRAADRQLRAAVVAAVAASKSG